MPKKERLAKENTAKKEIVAKGTKKIICLFKPQLSNEIMYFKFSQHSQWCTNFPFWSNPQFLKYYWMTVSHAFTFR